MGRRQRARKEGPEAAKGTTILERALHRKIPRRKNSDTTQGLERECLEKLPEGGKRIILTGGRRGKGDLRYGDSRSELKT